MSMAELFSETISLNKIKTDASNDEIDEAGEENKESVYDTNIIIEDIYGYIKVDIFFLPNIISF